MATRDPQPPLQVAIVGAGVAGLEAALALRALAGRRVALTLVDPGPDFVYRPMSVAEPFEAGEARHYPLARIAADLGAELVPDALDWVAPTSQRVFLKNGGELPYDALVIALGAYPVPAWHHVLTFSGPRDVDAMRRLVAEVERGETESVAFVVPDGTSWPLPLYELALMTAERARLAGREADLAIFTPERDPLAIVGHEGSVHVGRELDAAGIRVQRSNVVEVTAHGDIVIPPSEWSLRYERVVAVPRLAGPAVRGVPHDDDGFIPIDAHGLVAHAEHVYAAGDCTDYPVKQGGIAAQQADAVAEVIAKRAGAGIDPRPFAGVLRAQLLGGSRPRFLRTDLGGRATEHSHATEEPQWWPVAKIAATYLAPYLAHHDASPAPVDTAEPRAAFVPSYFENSPWGE